MIRALAISVSTGATLLDFLESSASFWSWKGNKEI